MGLIQSFPKSQKGIYLPRLSVVSFHSLFQHDSQPVNEKLMMQYMPLLNTKMSNCRQWFLAHPSSFVMATSGHLRRMQKLLAIPGSQSDAYHTEGERENATPATHVRGPDVRSNRINSNGIQISKKALDGIRRRLDLSGTGHSPGCTSARPCPGIQPQQ